LAAIYFNEKFQAIIKWPYLGNGEKQWRPPSILTGCILNHGKILHENALFLHKFFKKKLGEVAQSLSQTPPLPFRPLFRISGSATGEKYGQGYY